jgi:hypothetical protein
MESHEDEAFNEIERQAKQRKEAVRAAMRAIPWVGLTDEEAEYIEGMSMDAFVAIRMTEAKLKEKNT